MKIKYLYIILTIIFFMAGLVNLTLPDKVMINFNLSPLGKQIFITSYHIGATFLGFAIIFWLTRLSTYPKPSLFGRLFVALFLTVIIFLLIIITGLLSDLRWLSSIIAIFLITGIVYFIILKRRE